MNIDWGVIERIAMPLLTLFAGAWLNRRFESRPALVSYFSHVSAFTHRPPQGEPFQINTHTVVLKNTGRMAATNVRLRHMVLPEFNIWPEVVHNVESLKNGNKEIVIPILVPNEEITISYMYFPPLTVNQINATIKSDQGFAQQISVLLQRQMPRWFNWIVAVLTLMGLVTVVYFLFQMLSFLVSKLFT